MRLIRVDGQLYLEITRRLPWWRLPAWAQRMVERLWMAGWF